MCSEKNVTLEYALQKAISEQHVYVWITPGNPLCTELPRTVSNNSVRTFVMFDGETKNYGIAIEVEDTELYWEKAILSDDEFSVKNFQKAYPQLFEVTGSLEDCGTA